MSKPRWNSNDTQRLHDLFVKAALDEITDSERTVMEHLQERQRRCFPRTRQEKRREWRRSRKRRRAERVMNRCTHYEKKELRASPEAIHSLLDCTQGLAEAEPATAIALVVPAWLRGKSSLALNYWLEAKFAERLPGRLVVERDPLADSAALCDCSEDGKESEDGQGNRA